uniref:Uncharacterized protein n=1 Tax=Rhizophora mucronata TaxID=61149 RepID=A0A2P2P046_RHIMU
MIAAKAAEQHYFMQTTAINRSSDVTRT